MHGTAVIASGAELASSESGSSKYYTNVDVGRLAWEHNGIPVLHARLDVHAVRASNRGRFGGGW